jgi:hypothetical protein
MAHHARTDTGRRPGWRQASIAWIALLLLGWGGWASAADPCGGTQPGTSTAARIAATACRENVRWHSAFIDTDGRLASQQVIEAQAAPLADGVPAWQRVAGYWRETGLLQRMAGFDGASQCMGPVAGAGGAWCRAFLIDTPWSAAFVSWVMMHAGVPGFRPSPSHVDYVRAAYRGDGSPWRFADPDREPAATGDMLCYVRVDSRTYGHAGLGAFFAQPGSTGLPMHCDVVVGVEREAGRLHLVGGNVLHGVTRRLIPINRAGLPWNLPRGSGESGSCWPSNPAGCSFNRKDWAALLKLRPESEIATLAPAVRPVYGAPMAPPQQACCVNCVVGSGVPRCPQAGRPPTDPAKSD